MKKRLLVLTLMAAGTAVSPSVAFSQEPNAVQVNFEDVDIKDFTKVISKATGKNIIVPPNLRGKITIVSPRPIPKEELLNLYVAALDELGYQLIDYGDYAKIVKSRLASKEASSVSWSVGKGDKVTTYIFVPKHLMAFNLQGMIKNMLSPIGKATVLKEANAVIVTDKEKNIKRLLLILNRLDRSPVKFKIAEYRLKHADVKEAEKIVKALLEKSFAFEISKTLPTPGREYFHLVPDGRTNTLYLVATPKVVKEVTSLIPKIDRPGEVKKGNVHIIKLNYAFAEEVAKVLDELFKGGDKSYGLKGKVKIVADKASNSLIVLAQPEDFKVIESVIESLDTKRPQVFVEVQMVEMSMDKLLQMGVEWKFLSRGNYVPFGGSLYGNLPLQPGYPSASPGLIVGVAKWREGIPDVGLLINAYAKEGGVNVVATPQILTLDNKEAVINIGQVMPYSTGTKYDANNNPVISYTYKDVGIILKITPHVTSSGEIRLKVLARVEDVVGYANADQTAPITSKREASTTVDVKDGQTLVIGGLIKKKKLTTVEKVPVLGNIPVVGNLFKKTGHQVEKINLLIFITPRVIRTPEDELELTKTKVNEYRENIADIKRGRRGLLSDVKGFGKFELDEEPQVNVKEVN